MNGFTKQIGTNHKQLGEDIWLSCIAVLTVLSWFKMQGVRFICTESHADSFFVIR